RRPRPRPPPPPAREATPRSRAFRRRARGRGCSARRADAPAQLPFAAERTARPPARASAFVFAALAFHVRFAASGPCVKNSRVARPNVRRPSRAACPPVFADSFTVRVVLSATVGAESARARGAGTRLAVAITPTTRSVRTLWGTPAIRTTPLF